MLCAAPPATKSLSLGDVRLDSVTGRGGQLREPSQGAKPTSAATELQKGRVVNERQEPEESEETLAQALQRVKNAAPPERIEGKPETAKIPFAELDKAEKGG